MNLLLLSSCGGEWEKGFGGSLESIQANPLQWDSMGRCPGQWEPPVHWNFTLEQVQMVDKLVKHLEKVCWCPGCSRHRWLQHAGVWPRPTGSSSTLFITLTGEEVSGSDDKRTGTAATLIPSDRHSTWPWEPTHAGVSCSCTGENTDAKVTLFSKREQTEVITRMWGRGRTRWDLPTLGYTFSKGHVVNQDQRICHFG